MLPRVHAVHCTHLYSRINVDLFKLLLVLFSAANNIYSHRAYIVRVVDWPCTVIISTIIMIVRNMTKNATDKTTVSYFISCVVKACVMCTYTTLASSSSADCSTTATHKQHDQIYDTANWEKRQNRKIDLQETKRAVHVQCAYIWALDILYSAVCSMHQWKWMNNMTTSFKFRSFFLVSFSIRPPRYWQHDQPLLYWKFLSNWGGDLCTTISTKCQLPRSQVFLQ